MSISSNLPILIILQRLQQNTTTIYTTPFPAVPVRPPCVTRGVQKESKSGRPGRPGRPDGQQSKSCPVGVPSGPCKISTCQKQNSETELSGLWWALAGAGGHFSVDFDSIAGIFGIFGDDFRIFSPSLCPIHVDLEDPETVSCKSTGSTLTQNSLMVVDHTLLVTFVPASVKEIFQLSQFGAQIHGTLGRIRGSHALKPNCEMKVIQRDRCIQNCPI